MLKQNWQETITSKQAFSLSLWEFNSECRYKDVENGDSENESDAYVIQGVGRLFLLHVFALHTSQDQQNYPDKDLQEDGEANEDQVWVVVVLGGPQANQRFELRGIGHQQSNVQQTFGKCLLRGVRVKVEPRAVLLKWPSTYVHCNNTRTCAHTSSCAHRHWQTHTQRQERDRRTYMSHCSATQTAHHSHRIAILSLGIPRPIHENPGCNGLRKSRSEAPVNKRRWHRPLYVRYAVRQEEQTAHPIFHCIGKTVFKPHHMCLQCCVFAALSRSTFLLYTWRNRIKNQRT